VYLKRLVCKNESVVELRKVRIMMYKNRKY